MKKEQGENIEIGLTDINALAYVKIDKEFVFAKNSTAIVEVEGTINYDGLSILILHIISHI